MTFDGKITLALIFAAMVEAAAGFIWLGATSQRLTSVEAQIAITRPIAERMARMEEQVFAMRSQLDHIERELDAK